MQTVTKMDKPKKREKIELTREEGSARSSSAPRDKSFVLSGIID